MVFTANAAVSWSVGAHRQTRARWEARQSIPRWGSGAWRLPAVGHAPRVQIALDDRNKRCLYRDAAVLTPFAAHLDDGAVRCAAEVADVGIDEFLGAQAGQQRGEDDGAIALGPVAAPAAAFRGPSAQPAMQ
jgi:hypothetical protein